MGVQAFREHFYKKVQWTDIDPCYIKTCIELAKAEDLDALGWVKNKESWINPISCENHARGEAVLVSRSNSVLCGINMVQAVLDIYGSGCHFENDFSDGSLLKNGDCLGRLRGPMNVLLSAERVILNFLQHLSGIAYMTHKYVNIMGDAKTRLLDTRKTTPGLRALEKYAVACGGGWNHRKGLFDRIMLKDNDWGAHKFERPGVLKAYIDGLKQKAPLVPIEVEIDRLDQVGLVLDTQADAILFDNFSVEAVIQGLSLVQGKVYTEASGNITQETLNAYAHLGLDFISSGAITHQSVWSDISMDWL